MFWGEDRKSAQIFRLQKKVIRLIIGIKNVDLVSVYLENFKYSHQLPCTFQRYCALQKKYQGNVQQNIDTDGHNTRRKSDLHTLYCSTVLYQKSVTNRGIKLFNKLPIQIKQIASYKGYKREVKTFLLHNVFYTNEEFLDFEGSQYCTL